MENRNIKRQISPDEIDAEIHKRVLTEERFLKYNIAVATVFDVCFAGIVILSILRQNIRAGILFGVLTVVIGIAAFAYLEDYVRIKKRNYPCYLCRVEAFLIPPYLRVNEDVIAVYEKEDFRQVYPDAGQEMEDDGEGFEGESLPEIQAILIHSRDDNWYAFDMKWYKGNTKA